MKAYLDIETDRWGNISVIGIYTNQKGLLQLYGDDITTENNGYHAIMLWESYIKHGSSEALNLLLEYNREDVVNLISLESCLANLKEIE